MKWIKGHPKAAISAALLVALGVCIALFFRHYEFIDFTGRVSSSDAQIASTQATWFQAVFSVVAIFAAVGVGLWQSKEGRKLVQEERHRREILEEDAAYRRKMVYGSITMRILSAIHDEARERLEDVEPQLEKFTKMAAGPIRTEVLMPFLTPLLLSSVEFAPAADDIAERFDLTVALEVTSALDLASSFNRTLRGVINENMAAKYGSSEVVVDALRGIKARLACVRQKTESAMYILSHTYGVTGNE